MICSLPEILKPLERNKKELRLSKKKPTNNKEERTNPKRTTKIKELRLKIRLGDDCSYHLISILYIIQSIYNTI